MAVIFAMLKMGKSFDNQLKSEAKCCIIYQSDIYVFIIQLEACMDNCPKCVLIFGVIERKENGNGK